MADGPTHALRADVAVLGGGVAGLWTHIALAERGYSVVTLEARALGAGQTIASQGIIHAGVKYSLGGVLDGAGVLLAEMSRLWREALAGRTVPDLRPVPVLSPRTYLWTAPGLASRVSGWGAAHLMRASVERVRPEERPPGLAGAPASVRVYEADEPVLDVPGLLRRLAQEAVRRGPVVWCSGEPVLSAADDGTQILESASPDGRRLRVEASALVIASGAGNESVLARLGLSTEFPMQRRPLHMVMLRGAPAPLFGHCLGAGDLPRLTITTAGSPEGGGGGLVWYIGGAIAEGAAVERPAEAQIAAAREELARCAAWHDLRAARWSTLRIDRAEARTARGRRPEGPSVRRAGRVVVVWPTKLALAPAAAARAVAMIDEAGVARSGPATGDPDPVQAPPVATPPWDEPGRAWT